NALLRYLLDRDD
nr:Chain B, Nuclear receptor coactivator 3 [Homo sapiens]